MSSITLTKDHAGRKKGETISVSHVVGKDLIAKGIGVYPVQLQAIPKADGTDPEKDHLRRLVADLEGKLAEKDREIEALTAPKPAVPLVPSAPPAPKK